MANGMFLCCCLVVVVVGAQAVPFHDVRDALKRQDMFNDRAEKSALALEKAVKAMGDNFMAFGQAWLAQFLDDIKAYGPIVEELYDAVPAKTIHKFVVRTLTTAVKQSEDHCGTLVLKYNPLHPDLEPLSRNRRSTDKMTLTKFGGLLSTFMTDVDELVMNYVRDVMPSICDQELTQLKMYLAVVQMMKPEDLKEKGKMMW